MGQRERTYEKNRKAVLAYLQDGNFNNFAKLVRKTRCDRVQDDPILVELWHEACVMKKVCLCVCVGSLYMGYIWVCVCTLPILVSCFIYDPKRAPIHMCVCVCVGSLCVCACIYVICMHHGV